MVSSMRLLTNPFIIPIITPLLLLAFLYVYNQQQKYGKKKKKYHPFGGTVFHLLINFNTIHDYLTRLAEKYKTFRLIKPIQGQVFTADPANVEYILKTNFENYGKGKYTRDILQDLLGDGIFTVDGDEWREQRKLWSHDFSTKVLRDFSSVIFRKNAIKYGNTLLKAANNHQIISINDLFMKATMDSICEISFGIDFEKICGSNEEGARFKSAFDDANNLIVRRYFDISWKIKKFFNIGFEAELKKSIKVIDKFVYKLIQTKIEQIHKTKDEPSFKKKDILSRFIDIKENDPKFLRDIVLSFMLAGRDPIAVTMSWFIYMLCIHPEVQDKIAKEIKEVINIEEEEITNVADFEAYVSEGALQKMEYLHAALTETIRLYPGLALDPKICFSNDVLPDGCIVKKGDMIAYLPYAMGKMKFLWGDDASEFKPERWLDDNGCFQPENPFKFTAFQAGLRTCLGRDFAYRQMKVFSSILVGCFLFKLSDENKVPRYRTSINLHIDGPLPIHVFSRFGFIDKPQIFHLGIYQMVNKK